MKDKEPPLDLLDWMGVKAAPNWRVSRPLGPLLSIILALLFAVALAAAFAVLIRTFTGSPTSPGGSLGAGALIVAILGAPFLIWSTVLKHQTVRYQKEGHITDRINKAVEQLGTEKSVKRDGKETTEPNIEVRIGAILSLERIAQDSTRYDKGRDHVRVMEILCAYVRENSKATPPRDFPLPEWEPLKDDATETERKAHQQKRLERFGTDGTRSKAREWALTLPKSRADIAQALQVLGRRTAEQRQAEAAWPNPRTDGMIWPFDTALDPLPDVDGDATRTTAEIDAFKKKLEAWRKGLRAYSGYRLDLRGANLQGADLSAKRPDASDAVFSGALMQGARLEGANLWKARLEGANLWEVRMEGANLWKARLEGANLWGVRLEGANLWEVRMEGANLWKARMEGADLSAARLEGANLGARMEGVFLWRARMDGLTSLTAATFQGAAVRKMDFGHVPISAEQVNSSFGDISVELPEGMAWPDHWLEWEMDGESFNTEWRKWQADPKVYTPPPKPEG